MHILGEPLRSFEAGQEFLYRDAEGLAPLPLTRDLLVNLEKLGFS